MSRSEFLEQAGGVFQSEFDYDHWSGTEKWENFWAFFLDEDYGWVTSLYGEISINKLRRHHRHSIEHIIPRSTLVKFLSKTDVNQYVLNGATTNPFNLAPSDRYLNKTRSNVPFDLDGDRVNRPFDIYLNPAAKGKTGLDSDMEWVVPCHSRGNIARAVLYMVTVYNLDALYERQYEILTDWATYDPPTDWEKAYNQWIETKFGICNPLIMLPIDTFDWFGAT